MCAIYVAKSFPGGESVCAEQIILANRHCEPALSPSLFDSYLHSCIND